LAKILWVSTTQLAQAFNVTNYAPIAGAITVSTTESNCQVKIQSAGTGSLLDVYVSANSIATSASTVRTRKATANGAMSVSIGAGATGTFQDTSNSDSVSAGNAYNYQIVTPNTSGTLTIDHISIAYDASSNS